MLTRVSAKKARQPLKETVGASAARPIQREFAHFRGRSAAPASFAQMPVLAPEERSLATPFPYAELRLPIQRKLTIGAINDPLESEAAVAANSVMRGQPAPALVSGASPAMRRKCACEGSDKPCEACREEGKNKLLRIAARAVTPAEAPPVVDHVLHSPGQPLEAATRAFMEPRFGHDFSQVRVHTDEPAAESARAVDALAYTVGRHIVFGSEQYVPTTVNGKGLIAHELTHVLQQAGPGTTGPDRYSAELNETDQEHEADSRSKGIPSGTARTPHLIHVPVRGSGVRLQRQPQLPGPPPLQGQINLTVDDQGRVSLSIAGPQNIPVVKQPTIGIRRDPNGKYHLLVGGKDKLVSVDEIPALLRSAVGQAGTPGAKTPSPAIKVPSCSQLMTLDGTRFKTFAEHRIDRILNPNWLELTPALYDALVESCQPVQPDISRPAPQEALPPVVPKGMAVA